MEIVSEVVRRRDKRVEGEESDCYLGIWEIPTLAVGDKTGEAELGRWLINHNGE
jgi:hypothetical protein